MRLLVDSSVSATMRVTCSRTAVQVRCFAPRENATKERSVCVCVSGCACVCVCVRVCVCLFCECGVFDKVERRVNSDQWQSVN